MCIASHLVFRLVYTALFHLIATFEIYPADGQYNGAADPIKVIEDPTSIMAAPKEGMARFLLQRGKIYKVNKN